MKKQLIKLACSLGGLALSKYLTKNTPRILMYHGFSSTSEPGYVSTDELDWQLAYLKNKFNVLTLHELSNLLNDGKTVPENSIVITIDDGYRNFYDIAFPVFKKHNLSATFFVTSGFINKELWLWPDQLKWLLAERSNNASKIELHGKTFLFNGTSEDWQQLNDYCLSIGDHLKHEFLAGVAKAFGLEIPRLAPEKYDACTWEQLKEMQEYGIEIGAHTITHPSLGFVSLEKAKNEITGSAREIEKQLGRKVTTFCYPNGAPTDYNDDVKAIVQEHGFLSAVTAYNDFHDLNIPFAWRRYSVTGNRYNFTKTVCGVELLSNKLSKRELCSY